MTPGCMKHACQGTKLGSGEAVCVDYGRWFDEGLAMMVQVGACVVRP